jgi:hypothetical protein
MIKSTNSRLHQRKERLSKLKDRLFENVQLEPEVVFHAYNPGTQEAKAER